MPKKFGLARSTKLNTFFGEKLDHGIVSDNRKFWKTVCRLFSELSHEKSINLNNNDKTISNNDKLAEIFYKNFSKLVENLDIDKTLPRNITRSYITDPVWLCY